VANEVILVVEDNERNRKLVRDVLAFKGYELIEAEMAEEGIRLAQERRPSPILMDIRLPGTDGVEALGRLKAERTTRDIPVMAMTASVMASDRQRVLDAGFGAFQSKPIQRKRLPRGWNSSLNVIEDEGRAKRGVQCTATWADVLAGEGGGGRPCSSEPRMTRLTFHPPHDPGMDRRL
jgi:two-component system, cell cycle response regulator DivK